jgi:BCD family chlorophyll transporter-like MFS transporter
MHTVQTAGLALATDLAPPERQPQVVGLMYVMQLIGMIGSALVLGFLLHDYSPGQLIRVVQAVAVTTLVLNVIALWKQEPRSRLRKPGTPIEYTFTQSWQLFCQGQHTVRRLLAVGLGTMAFTMEDVLLEPYGGEILHMSVSSTTLLSATLALGGLLGLLGPPACWGGAATPTACLAGALGSVCRLLRPSWPLPRWRHQRFLCWASS